MSKPTELELQELQDAKDDDTYHSVFDDILEKKLMELDPEWMTEISRIYQESGMARWTA